MTRLGKALCREVEMDYNASGLSVVYRFKWSCVRTSGMAYTKLPTDAPDPLLSWVVLVTNSTILVVRIVRWRCIRESGAYGIGIAS